MYPMLFLVHTYAYIPNSFEAVPTFVLPGWSKHFPLSSVVTFNFNASRSYTCDWRCFPCSCMPLSCQPGQNMTPAIIEENLPAPNSSSKLKRFKFVAVRGLFPGSLRCSPLFYLSCCENPMKYLLRHKHACVCLRTLGVSVCICVSLCVGAVCIGMCDLASTRAQNSLRKFLLTRILMI